MNREPCPKCRAKGNDRSGDNLITFPDGGKKCFACGYGIPAKGWVITNKPATKAAPASIPSDFTREVPAAGWKWLLQYGLSYDYWKDYTGYSEKDKRLIITVGNPIQFSQGRDLTGEGIKWKTYGRPHDVATVLGNSETSTCTVLVEDIISAHKVAQFQQCIPLFGTAILPPVISYLSTTNKPIVVWLDYDQLPQMKKKVNRLSLFLSNKIKVIHTERDPKEHTLTELKELLDD